MPQGQLIELALRTAKAAYFKALKDPTGDKAFVYPMLSTKMESDQALETYAWLGQVPQMRKWRGLREIHALREHAFVIRNERFENTIRIPGDDWRREKLGQIGTRSKDMAVRTRGHRENLFFDAVLLGATTNCYDNQFLFDTDHVDPGALYQTSQSNVVSKTVVDPDAVTVAELEGAIDTTLQRLRDLKDDQGEVWNFVEDLHWLFPTNMTKQAKLALGTGDGLTAADVAGGSGAFRGEGTVHISAQIKARQAALGQANPGRKFWLFNAAMETKPIVHQVEREPTTQTLGEGSDHFFKTDELLVGVEASYTMGYGPWQGAIEVRFTT